MVLCQYVGVLCLAEGLGRGNGTTLAGCHVRAPVSFSWCYVCVPCVPENGWPGGVVTSDSFAGYPSSSSSSSGSRNGGGSGSGSSTSTSSGAFAILFRPWYMHKCIFINIYIQYII